MSTSPLRRISQAWRSLVIGLVAVLVIVSSAPPPIAAVSPPPAPTVLTIQDGNPGPGSEPSVPPATVVQAATPTTLASPSHATFQTGDVFAAVGNTPIVQWRLPDGTLNQTLNLGYPAPGAVAAGMAFGPDGTLYATSFNAAQIYEFSVTGASGPILGGQCCSGDYNLPESIASDRAGHLIVGQAGGNPGSITAPIIHKIDLAGNFLGQWTVATDSRGADWVDVQPDGCTVLYTSEGTTVKRFNVCTAAQLTNFATSLPGANAFALRILPDGSVLVADTSVVVHLNASGQVIQTYSVSGETYLFALALDSNGTSFWAGSQNSGNVYKFNITSGALEGSFYAGGAVNGLAVYNASAIAPQGPPAAQTLGGGAAGPNPNGVRVTDETREPVNTLTGNYTSTVTDFALPGRGLNFAFTRTYNSQGAGTGALGPGWTDAYAVNLRLNGDGSITFTDENGAQYLYLSNGSGGWIRPAGGRSTLTTITGGYQLIRHDQVRYSFDTSGVLLREADRNGNALTFSYAAGLLTQITDPVGRTIGLTYNAGNHLTTLAGPPSRQVTYGYNGAGQLASVTDLRGGLTGYTYDAAGRLATITDQNNHVVVTNLYDAAGRVQTQTDAAAHTAIFGWDLTTTTSTLTDARGGVWTDVYVNGVLARQSDPLGNTTTYGYDPALDALVTTDGRGNSTSATYDASGNVVTLGGAGELSLDTYAYDALNDVLSHTDGRGNSTSYQYDVAGNLITVIEPGGATVQYGRDPAGSGLLVSLTDERGKTTSYGHDAQANLTSITTPLGELATMTYDTAGRRLTSVDPRGNVTGGNPALYRTTFTYNNADALLTTTDPLANLTSYTYDPAGNLATVTDPNQHTSTYGYDPDNRLSSVTDGTNDRTTYGYDVVGDLTSRTDGNTHLTTNGYDLADRLTTTTDPLNHVWTTTLDAAGNAISRLDPNGKTTTYGYDALNRLTSITYAAGTTPVVRITYDADGNRTQMYEGNNSLPAETFTYDALNRLTADNRGSDTFTYGHDAAGDITSRTYPGQAIQTLVYDDDGRLTSANGATNTYDAAANLLTVATPDGFTARYAYDRAGRLLEVAHTRSNGTLSRFTYGLDPVGNRIAMTTRQATVTYRYDGLNRLTEACWSPTSCPGGPPAAPLACIGCIGNLLSRPAASTNPPAGETYRRYTYDPVGNRLTEVSNAGTTSYAYDSSDRLTSVTAPGNVVTSYTFDSNGNQTAAGPSTFTYDLADRLKTATVAGVTETYAYMGDGTRLSASTGAQANKTTKFLVDRSLGLPQVAIERNGNDALLRAYRYGLDLVSQTDGSTTTYYHHDGLGSVADISGSTGTSLFWAEYYPYGLIRQSGAGTKPPTNPFRFTGEQFDAATGLYYLRARQYDPATGRFLATDPQGPALSDPYVSAYAYANGNPIRYTDPSGRCIGPIFIVCVAAVVGVLSYVGSTVLGNGVSNLANNRPLEDDIFHGLNPGDAIIAGGVGALTGPLGAITFAPTRILATAAYGCAATFASQAIGGRTGNLVETGVGCAFGAFAGVPKIASPILSALYGFLVATAQAISNWATSGQGATSPSAGNLATRGQGTTSRSGGK